MRAVLLAATILFTASHALADDTNEDRLRQALKQSVTQMRAAQDAAAAAQAQLSQAQADLTSTKTQLDAANAKLAQSQGKASAKPEELKALQDQLNAAQSENGQLRQSLQQFQSRVGQAQDFARAREEEARSAQAGLTANTKALQTCKTANTKLIAVSEQILNLWRDKSFLWVLRKSYEPLVGASKVDLENLVQDYDDKLRDQEYIVPLPKK